MQPEGSDRDHTIRAIVVALSIGAIWAGVCLITSRKKIAKKKVFISFDFAIDLKYKNLLSAWAANDRFDFDIEVTSPSVAIDSTAAGTIKTALTKKLQDAEILLVIVGKETAKSPWITWEIDRAKMADIKLPLVGVKIDQSYTSPTGLLKAGTEWAMSFTRDSIVKALDSAKAAY
jgi:hypothetical protein